MSPDAPPPSSAPVYDPALDPTADDAPSVSAKQPTKILQRREWHGGAEAVGLAALAAADESELEVESDLSARLNEVLVTSVEATVGAVRSLTEPSADAGGLQGGGGRVHRASVYGLTREPPPWATRPGSPTTSSKLASFARSLGGPPPRPAPPAPLPSCADVGVWGVAGKKPQKLTAEEVVGGRQLHSKVAVVTGASGGLGYETARVLCKVRPRPPRASFPAATSLASLQVFRPDVPLAAGWLTVAAAVGAGGRACGACMPPHGQGGSRCRPHPIRAGGSGGNRGDNRA